MSRGDVIGIVDYGIGNLASIANMLRRVGLEARVVSRPEELERVGKLILPGVGAFDHGMRQLRRSGLMDAVQDRAYRVGVPTLGICLGLQLFANGSEEGMEPGLGWLAARVVGFDADRLGNARHVPHMGWAELAHAREAALTADLPPSARFYFVHSYHLTCEAQTDVVATAQYGYEFPAVVQRDNLIGVQFHPEKSHRFGMQILRNFGERY